MCGLVGIAGPGIQYEDIQALEDLTHVIALRGQHGTGIVQGKTSTWAKYSKSKIQDLILEKSQHDSSYFKKWHDWAPEGNKNLFSGVFNNFFCVHVRHATMGGINKANAHPFDVGSLIGMHNGTLRDKRYLHKDKTDSELMFQDMEQRGIETVLSELDKDSAYAIVVLNKEDGTISFARNEKRELYFCYSEKRNVMYWASEEWMLRGVLGRNRISIKGDEIWYFTPGRVYTMDPSKPVKKVGDFTITELKPKEKPAVRVPASVRKANAAGVVVDLMREKELRENKKEVKVEKKQINESVIDNPYCCACQRPLKLVEQYFAKKFSPNTVICSDCDLQSSSVILN